MAAIVSLSNHSLQAQEGQSGLVAILDVARVFKDNLAFESKMATIRTEAEKLKAQITQQQEAIKLKAQGLAQFEIGSAERSSLEESLEISQAKLRTYARGQENQLLNREARVYYETYRQMQDVVGSLANQHGISLVLRFESEEIDPDNRPDVIKGVNRSVVFHQRVDLTKMVTAAMNANPAQAQVPAQTQLK